MVISYEDKGVMRPEVDVAGISISPIRSRITSASALYVN